MISIQRIMKSSLSELRLTSQIERKNTYVFYSSQNFTLSEFKASSECGRHSLYHKRKPSHGSIAFISRFNLVFPILPKLSHVERAIPQTRNKFSRSFPRDSLLNADPHLTLTINILFKARDHFSG